MKTLRRDISYNQACAIMEANNYKVTFVKVVNNEWTVFYSGDRKIARYNVKYGKLQVVEN